MNWCQPSDPLPWCNAGVPTRGSGCYSVLTVAASASVQGSRGRTDGGDLSLGWMGPDGHEGAAQVHKRRAVDP